MQNRPRLYCIAIVVCLFVVPSYASELIHTTAALSQERGNLAATSVGTKALFAGGGYSGGLSNVVDIYDQSTGQWSTATLSQARYYLAATSVEGMALFAGGEIHDTGPLPSGLVDIYDADADSWSAMTLSIPRWWLAGTTVGNQAVFAGGYDWPTYSSVVDIYTIPEPATLSLLALGGLAMLRQRRTQGVVLKRYTTSPQNSWSQHGPVPKGRHAT